MAKIKNFCTIKYCILFRGEKTFSDTVLNSTEILIFWQFLAKIIYQYLIVQKYFFNFRKGQQATGANAQLLDKSEEHDQCITTINYTTVNHD